MMHLILFESDPALLPKDLEIRKSQWLAGIAMFKEEIKKENISAFGMSLEGNKGFILTNQSPKQLFAKRIANLGTVKTTTMPMLTLEEAEDVIKEL